MCSDTDDTDDLLLIPPDFFLVQSEPEPPYYSIVDSLIKQVSNLQNRIETIECTSDVSLVGSYVDIRDNMTSIQTKNSVQRQFLSQEDFYEPKSTQSTPQKPREKHRLNSLPNSPSVTLRQCNFKFKSPQKNSKAENKLGQDPEILNEIDTFISNVKTIQRNHTVRNLENEFDTSGSSSLLQRNENINGTGNTQCPFDKTTKLSENIRLDHNPDNIAEMPLRQTTWRCGDDIRSVPDYGTGIRNSLYTQKSTNENLTKSAQMNPSYHTVSSGADISSCSTLDRSDSSSESTQITAYDKYKKQESISRNDQRQRLKDQVQRNVDHFIAGEARDDLVNSPLHSNALNILNMHKKLLNSNDINNGQMIKQRSINTLSNSIGLLSLADIWGTTHLTQSPSKLTQKLQEEKLRRQHCEQIINELQNKNLELQQKLSVAIKVDDTKNSTIKQFQEALEKVSLRMEKLNEEKSTWELDMARLKTQHAIDMDRANQNISHYEREASKSLNLAHSNQEKISFLEQKCSDLQKDLGTIENKFKEVEENYKKEFEKNKSLSEIISQKEIELKENKTVLNNAREEVSQSRKAVEICQAEFTALKNECSKMENELKDDKNLILNLSDQKRKLINEIETYRSNEKTLKEGLDESHTKLEKTKLELRNFYQGQLELIVENKRKEMQTQLDQERQRNLEELKRKELSMAKTAANHIKEISEKCSLETKLLEQKYQEEIKLYEVQMCQYRKEIEVLQKKLANLPEKRAQIAKQLQQVMENQWNEALKMIDNTPSPISHEQKVFHNANSLLRKAPPQSYTALRDHQQGQETFESASDYDETPVSSRAAKSTESEIQKYINMLLNRAPGQPVQETPEPNVPQQRATWHPGDQENENKYDTSTRLFSKERRNAKPPWK